MKTKEAFGVAVRLIGLVVGLFGAFLLVSGLIILITPQHIQKAGGAIDFLVGFLLLRSVRDVVSVRIFR